MKRAEMRVTPQILEKLLELPGGVAIIDARYEGDTGHVILTLESEDALPEDAAVVLAEYSHKPTFDRFVVVERPRGLGQ